MGIPRAVAVVVEAGFGIEFSPGEGVGVIEGGQGPGGASRIRDGELPETVIGVALGHEEATGAAASGLTDEARDGALALTGQHHQ